MCIEEKIRKIIAGILKVDESMIKEDTAIGELPGWDSLNQMRILTAIESETGMQFTVDVLLELEDFKDIAEAVKALGGN